MNGVKILCVKIETVRETLRFNIAHEDLTVYNAVQKLLEPLTRDS